MPREKTVLYVDDYADSRKLVRRVLEGEGYLCIEAENAADALRQLERGEPDLILIDINLPDMNGYALTEKIRGRSSKRRIPILAVTANTRPREYQEPSVSTFDSYIQKPIDIDVLLRQIRRFLPN